MTTKPGNVERRVTDASDTTKPGSAGRRVPKESNTVINMWALRPPRVTPVVSAAGPALNIAEMAELGVEVDGRILKKSETPVAKTVPTMRAVVPDAGEVDELECEDHLDSCVDIDCDGECVELQVKAADPFYSEWIRPICWMAIACTSSMNVVLATLLYFL